MRTISLVKQRLIVETTVKTMFDFVPKRGHAGLVYDALAVDGSHWGIGCPNVADAIDLFGEAFSTKGAAVTGGHGDGFGIHAVPDNADAIGGCGSAPREQAGDESKAFHIHPFILAAG